MNLSLFKKLSFVTYLSLAGLILAVFLLFLPQSPVTLLFITLNLFFFSGYSIAKIFKLNKINDSFSQFAFWVAIGFIFTMLVAMAGIVLALTISWLTWLYFSLIVLLFGLAITFELRELKQDQKKFKIDWKSFSIGDILAYLLILIIAFFIFLSLIKAGSFFKGGDVNYHLAIINKAISGHPLGISSLSYVKGSPNIAYGFPIWHVFLAMIATLTKSSIFAIWKDMAIVLTGFSFIIWFWFCRRIFNHNFIASTVFILYMIIAFYWGGGYLFSTAPIPHSLSQMALVPLLVIMALEYIYQDDKVKGFSMLILVVVSALLLGAVHLTTYFYYLFAVLAYLLILLTQFKKPDFTLKIKRTLTLILASIAVILPLAIILELKDQTITNNLRSFSDPDYPTALTFNSFVAYGPFLKYAFLGLPLVLFFLRKNQKLLILFSVFLLIPITYSSLIGPLLIKSVGYIFVNRLIGTYDWSWLVLGLVAGSVFIFIGNSINRLKSRFLSYLIFILTFTGALIAIFWQFKNNWALDLFEFLFSDKTLARLDHYYLWIIGLLLLSFLIYFFLSYKKPKPEVKKNTGFAPSLFAFPFLLVLALIFISPDLSIFKTSVEKNHFKYFLRSSKAFGQAKTDYYTEWAGGKDIINYINQELPAKSIFDTNLAYFILPIVTDQHMPVYHTKAQVDHLAIYEEKTSLVQRLELLNLYRIEYLLVKKPKKGIPVFEQYPQYFTKLFENNHSIYKVNKEQIAKDLPILKKSD